MNTFTTALKAEHIKKKGTGVYWLAVILGAFLPIAYSLVMIIDPDAAAKKGDAIPYDYFLKVVEEMLGGFTVFFFPLLIIITISRITQLDHKNGGWQLMETQPLHKRHIYFSKFTVVLITNLIAILTLVAASYLAGSFILLFREAPKDATFGFPAIELLQIISRLFLAGLFLSALQYLISVLLPSFIWGMLIGFFLLLSYLFLQIFNVVPDWYPIEFLNKVSEYKKGSELGYWITYSEIAAVLLALLTLYIGFNWYRHKNLKRAFAGNSLRAVSLVGVLLLTGGLLAYTLSPNSYLPYATTVIAGKIESKEKITMLYITDYFIHDTIAAIPVVNNTFHFEIKKEVPLDAYQFVTDNQVNGNIVFGSKDSIYLLIKKNKKALEGKITGTRLAENQYSKKNETTYSMAEYYLQQNEVDNPQRFGESLIAEWKAATEASDKFKTADNYVPRPDFLQKDKKRITITYLNYWQEFVKKRKVMYAGEPTPELPEITAMKKTVPLDDEGLLSDETYFAYVKYNLIVNDEEDIDENKKAIRAIAKLKPGSFKDKMLYWQLKTSLAEASARSERDMLMEQYAGTFTDKKYSGLIAGINKTLQNLDKGQLAPAIAGTDVDQKAFNLEQYKGKLVAIDVWATWCGPCREQSPKFEKLAQKYKNENITFIALSTDDNITDWVIEAKLKTKSVRQVHADDKRAFGANYNIEFIPRFILIGTDGKLINANMPRPSEKTFEEILRRELGLGDEK